MVATFCDHQRLSSLGNLVQLFLAAEDVVLQTGQVQLCTGSQEMLLRLFGNIYPCQHPGTGCLCSVIHLGDMAPVAFLVEELLTGKEPVHQEMQRAVQPVQEVHLFLGVMPVMPRKLPDDRVVLLLHMGIVILVVGTGPGEGDAMGMAETDEVSIHELSSIVRMQEDRLPWVPVKAGLQAATT